MMIVVTSLRRGGVLGRLATWALGRVRRPRGLLAMTMILSAGLSAALVNDMVCLALTPLVLHLARRLKLDPPDPRRGRRRETITAVGSQGVRCVGSRTACSRPLAIWREKARRAPGGRFSEAPTTRPATA
jgi:hypothetical protein